MDTYTHRLRWLDHCPFTATDRDRRPVGVPNNWSISVMIAQGTPNALAEV